MTRFQAEVRVIPRPGLLDPEGKAIHHALESLDYPGVGDVRVGKVIQIDLEAGDESAARTSLEEMCDRLLANPVTEDYRIELRPEGGEDA